MIVTVSALLITGLSGVAVYRLSRQAPAVITVPGAGTASASPAPRATAAPRHRPAPGTVMTAGAWRLRR